MITLLAQAASSAPTFTPAQLWAVLAVLVFILSAVALVKKVFGHEPPLHKEYVTKADHEKDRDEILAELKRHAGRRAEIYDVQKEQGQQLAGLQRATESLNDELKEMKLEIREVNRRIDDIPKRTIETLNATKQLHG